MQIDINLPNYKFVTYEIPLLANSSGTQYNFPVNMYLTGRKVAKIIALNNNDITNSPISTANVVWTPTMMRNAAITIHAFDPTRPNDNGAKGDWIKNLPVNMLHSVWTTDGAAPAQSVFNDVMFANLLPDWNNSFITFVNPQVFSANTSALFGVWYI